MWQQVTEKLLRHCANGKGLRTAPQTDAALEAMVQRGGKGLGPAKAKRSKRVSMIIANKAQGKAAA